MTGSPIKFILAIFCFMILVAATSAIVLINGAQQNKLNSRALTTDTPTPPDIEPVTPENDDTNTDDTDSNDNTNPPSTSGGGSSVANNPQPTQQPPEINGDLNNDGTINEKDIRIVEAYYNAAYTPLINSPDYNQDGIVDLSDLAALLAVYGPYSGESAFDLIQHNDQIIDDRDKKIIEAFYGQAYTGINNPDFNHDGIVDLSDLAALLSLF